MFKTVKQRVWAFDAEWIPDPVAGKLLYGLPDNTPDLDVFKRMWKEGGATEEDPTPYLKTVVCRIVSVAAVDRFESGRKAKLHLLSLPRELDDPVQVSEKNVVGTFLDKVGQYKPQLVGFNSSSADLKAFIQRSVVLGIQAVEFCRRPPSLNEIATLSGIPGKLDVNGEEVAFLWLDGKLDEIVAYNEFDALTTYLVWLRVAHFGGHFTSAEYEVEQQLVRELILSEIENGKVHLKKYLDEWDRLKEIVT